MRSRRSRDSCPQSDACVAPDVARAVRCRLGVLDNAILCDQLIQSRWIMKLKHVVESLHHFFCRRSVVISALDILICRHMKFSLRADCLAASSLADWFARGNYLRG